MLRLNWSRIARRLFSFSFSRRRPQRRRLPASVAPAVEVLEARWLLAAPVAVNDSYNVVHNQTLNPGTGVLGNDYDPDSDPITAVKQSDPAHGQLTLNSDGTFSFVPDNNYVGADGFSYKAFDGTNYSGLATVSINVTNQAAIAVTNAYMIYKNTFDSAAEGAAGVLGNDYEYDGDPLTAVLGTDAAHGDLTLNSNGSFTYTPDAEWFGTDTFTYYAHDGFVNSSACTVSLNVVSPFGDQTNISDQPWFDAQSYGSYGVSRQAGALQVGQSLGFGHELVYDSLTADPRPIVAMNSSLISGAPVPTSVEATLTFGGVEGDTVYYSTSGLSAGMSLRFAAQADATSLATGWHEYELTLVGNYSGGLTATRTFTGSQYIVNRSDSPLGQGWNLAELDRLVPDDGGLLYVTGAGSAAWFEDNLDDTFDSPAGPLAFHTLVRNQDDSYTLTDKFGNRLEFDDDGLLTDRVDLNGNTTSYAYIDANSDSVVEEISEITDPFGRVVEFDYTSGYLSSVTDFADRTIEIGQTSGKLTEITLMDPDAGGSQTSPVTSFAYHSSGRMTGVTDPLDRETEFAYNFAGRMDEVTNPDDTTRQFVPIQMRSLIDTATSGTQGNPASLYTLGYANSTTTDELNYSTSARTDRFGNVLYYADALGNVTTLERNSNGLVTQTTGADPDGAGSGSAAVTQYTYDAAGNQTEITFADSTTQSWTYDEDLNLPLTFTDQFENVTEYDYDEDGNLLTVTDVLDNVTTYTYTTRGQVASVTTPDPDGEGGQASGVTEYEYDTYGRLITITNADDTTRAFTYDDADNLLTVTDELARVTTYEYDLLDRLISVTLEDPDGAQAL